jgi:hypothetical protein
VVFSALSFDEASESSFCANGGEEPDVIVCDLLVASPNDVLRAVLLKSKAELAGVSVIFISNQDITVSQLGNIRTFDLNQAESGDLLKKLCAMDRKHSLSAVGQFV